MAHLLSRFSYDSLHTAPLQSQFSSLQNGRELSRIGKQRVGEKKHAVGVSCLKDESGAVKVWLIEIKSGRSI